MENLSKKIKVTVQPDWTDCHLLPLFSILDKLEEPIDHVQFRAVCKSWRLVAKLHHQNCGFKSKMLPMLMISTESENKQKMSLYSIPRARIHPFRPLMNNDVQLRAKMNNEDEFICGYSHGWLATYGVGEDTITLFNPFKNVAPIYLPPLSKKHCFSYSKVTLSADPITSGSDYVVAIFDRVYFHLAFIRAGEKCWTYVDMDNYYHFSHNDFTFYKGLIYLVDHEEGMVLSIDPYQLSPTQEILPNLVVPKGSLCHDPLQSSHLVKSLEGDLLVVVQENLFEKRFEVYKLELDAERGNLVKLETLGDNVLFVGRFDSFAVSASYFPSYLQKDSIFYHQPFCRHDLEKEKMFFETYNIKDQSSHCHYYYKLEAYSKEYYKPKANSKDLYDEVDPYFKDLDNELEAYFKDLDNELEAYFKDLNNELEAYSKDYDDELKDYDKLKDNSKEAPIVFWIQPPFKWD